jgi:hypothetical protein
MEKRPRLVFLCVHQRNRESEHSEHGTPARKIKSERRVEESVCERLAAGPAIDSHKLLNGFCQPV